MKRDMKTLQQVLWEQFESAVGKQASYDKNDYNSSTQNYPGNHALENRKLIAELGQALALTNAELRADAAEIRLEEQLKREGDIGKGTVRPVSALPSIALKPPGTP